MNIEAIIATIWEKLLGNHEYSEIDTKFMIERDLLMPEGFYPTKYRVYWSVWYYPRWMVAKRAERVTVKIFGGVPVPWEDMNENGHDDVREITMPLAGRTIKEVYDDIAINILTVRAKYASIDWKPQDEELDRIIEQYESDEARTKV
jgi:hypothetical protein